MKNQPRPYHVRKNNTISYRSNFYSLPEGTYRGRGTEVLLKETGPTFSVYFADEELICTHQLARGKGQTIINTNHRRDTSKSLDELIGQAAGRFTHPEQARTYLAGIRERLPRYIRDHLQCITKALQQVDTQAADATLAFCLKNELYSGSEFEQVLRVHCSEPAHSAALRPTTLLHTDHGEKANQAPQTSNLDDYESLMNS